MTEPDFVTIIETLAKHDAAFIVVGGMGAILQGVQTATYDVDVVHSRTPENLTRLLAALQELDAWYRLRTDRKLRPGESHLASLGHQLLRTKYGDLDVL